MRHRIAVFPGDGLQLPGRQRAQHERLVRHILEECQVPFLDADLCFQAVDFAGGINRPEKEKDGQDSRNGNGG